MRERALLVGARLTVEQSTDGGTAVALFVPIDPAGPDAARAEWKQ
jgi:hypothetical protein